MSDPRNVAHDKKVQQEKEHHKPGSDAETKAATAKPDTAETADAPTSDNAPGDLEKSAAVLSKLKEMEFHSRANLETLAGLTLTIDDELKQKEFSDPIAELYGAQDGFQTKIAALIEKYDAAHEALKPSA